MKKTASVILLILFQFCVFAQTVTINTGAGGTQGTSSNVVVGLSGYHVSESIYTEAEIGTGNFELQGTAINKIGYFVNTVGSPTAINSYKIYMKNVATGTTTFTSGNSYSTIGYTLVFDGSVNFTSTGLNEIVLQTEFVRSSGFNLQVLIERLEGTSHTGYSFATANGNQTSNTISSSRRYNSNTAPSATTTLTASGLRPAIVLVHFDTTPTPIITSPNPSSISDFSYMQGSGPSTERSFTFSIVNGQDGLIIAPPANFEVSVYDLFVDTFYAYPCLGCTDNHIVSVRMKAGLPAGNYSGNIIISATGAESKYLPVSGVVSALPSITVSTNSLTGFTFSENLGGSNAPQLFYISGSGLIDNIHLAFRENNSYFEISNNPTTGFGQALDIPQNAGLVNNVPVYVRIKLPRVGPGTIANTLFVSSNAATNKQVYLQGNITFASIYLKDTNRLSLSNLNFSHHFSDTTTSSQKYFISGNDLLNNIKIKSTTPVYFQFSLNPDSGFSDSLILTQSGGIVPNTGVYFKFKSGLPTGIYNGQVSLMCGNTSLNEINCTGNVICPSASTSFEARGNNTYTLPWGLMVSSSGYYSHTYQTTLGCDSSVIAYITIDKSPSVNSKNLGVNVTNPQRSLHVNDIIRLEPRNTTPENPTKGDLYFDGNINRIKYYDGSAWIVL